VRWICIGVLLGLLVSTATVAQEKEVSWANCEICSLFMADKELMKATDFQLLDWSQGVICLLHLKDPKLMPQFRAMGERDEALSRKFSAMSVEACAKHLCPFCVSYFSFVRRGSTEERIKTPAGAIHIVKAKDPALVKDIHAWAEQGRKAMASFGDEGKGDKAPAENPWLEMMKKCHLCCTFAEHPELMWAAKNQILHLTNGMAMNSVVKKPEMLKAYQKFMVGFNKKAESLDKFTPEEAKKKLCHFCCKLHGLGHNKAVFSWTLTREGDLLVITGDTPDLIKRIHEVAGMYEKAFEMAEKQQK